MTAPTGQYDNTKLVNVGINRWSFKPEVGVSKALGQWILEGAAGVTFYTDNDQYFGNNVRQQDPLYSVQAHLIYNFSPSLWGSLDATYYCGGRTTVNDTLNNDLQQNWRWGGVLAQSLDIRNSIKLYFSSGVVARTGTAFTTVGVAGSIAGAQGSMSGCSARSSRTPRTLFGENGIRSIGGNGRADIFSLTHT